MTLIIVSLKPIRVIRPYYKDVPELLYWIVSVTSKSTEIVKDSNILRQLKLILLFHETFHVQYK